MQAAKASPSTSSATMTRGRRREADNTELKRQRLERAEQVRKDGYITLVSGELFCWSRSDVQEFGALLDCELLTARNVAAAAMERLTQRLRDLTASARSTSQGHRMGKASAHVRNRLVAAEGLLQARAVEGFSIEELGLRQRVE